MTFTAWYSKIVFEISPVQENKKWPKIKMGKQEPDDVRDGRKKNYIKKAPYKVLS